MTLFYLPPWSVVSSVFRSWTFESDPSRVRVTDAPFLAVMEFVLNFESLFRACLVRGVESLSDVGRWKEVYLDILWVISVIHRRDSY